MFQTYFTLWHMKLNICMQEIKFTFHKQYLFGRLFSRNAKKTHADKSPLQIFHSVSKETTHKPSKVAASKNLSSSVHAIDTTCFDECFLFHLITGSHYFFVKVCRYFEIFPATILYCTFLWNKCFERSPYFTFYLHIISVQC